MSHWIPIAHCDEIPEGFHRCVKVRETEILLFHRNGEYHAIENNCTHLNLSMSEGELFDVEYICPWHGAAFDITTGKCLGPPGRGDVRSYPTRLSQNQIEILAKDI